MKILQWGKHTQRSEIYAEKARKRFLVAKSQIKRNVILYLDTCAEL